MVRKVHEVHKKGNAWLMDARALRLLTICLVLTALPWPGNALAQSARIEPFQITSLDGEAYVETEYRDHEETSSGGVSTKEREFFFEEGIELDMRSYVYHPNLVDLSTTLRLGFNQQLREVNGEDRNGSGTLIGYDLAALVLREKPVSLFTFASRSDDVINRDFSESVELARTRQGFELLTKGDFPTSLFYEYSTLDETSELRQQEENTHLIRFRIADQRDVDFFTDLVYEFETTDATSTFTPSGGGASTVTESPIDRQEAKISNRWHVDPGDQDMFFFGGARVLQRRGSFERDLLRLDQSLEWTHTDFFDTFYRFEFDDDVSTDQQERQISGEAGFNLDVYDSLDLTGRGRVDHRDFGTGEERIVSGSLDASYIKQTPIGTYRATLGLGKEYQSQTSDGGLRRFNETVTLVGLTASRLSQPNVVAGTISVTNLAETVTYVLGTDYTRATLGAFTEITRLGVGGIASGETVRVRYTAAVSLDGDFTTDRLSTTHRLELDDLPVALFVEYRLEDEYLLTGADPGNLETQTVLLTGIEITLFEVVTTYEHEIRNQELSPPTVADRVHVRYTKPFTPDIDLSLGGQFEHIEFLRGDAFGLTAQEQSETSITAFAVSTMRLNRRTLLRLFSDVTDSRGRNENFIARIGLGLEWRYRDLEVLLDARHDIFAQNDDEGSSNLVSLRITRKF